MKAKVTSLILVIVILALGFYLMADQSGRDNSAAERSGSAQRSELERTERLNGGADTQFDFDLNSKDLDFGFEGDLRPATEIYANDREALEAVLRAAEDYDDIVLEQFVNLGEECSWCPGFYNSVKDIMFAPDTDEEKRSYLAEILAVSGRLENIKALVEAIETSRGEDAEIYAEALELSEGGDQIIRFLADQLNTENELLKEASVAAITGQGSRLAAETLYNHTVESGSVDGYYDLGIGLGELVPDAEALPYLQELALRRDQYSHLAIKALLNSGLDGLRIVFDVLTNSPNIEADRSMLRDAIDHVVYEEEIETYVKQIAQNSNQPIVQEFAREILEDFALEEEDDLEDDEDYDL